MGCLVALIGTFFYNYNRTQSNFQKPAPTQTLAAPTEEEKQRSTEQAQKPAAELDAQITLDGSKSV